MPENMSIDEFRPSRLEKNELKRWQLKEYDDGTFEIVEKDPKPFTLSPVQRMYIERIFWDAAQKYQEKAVAKSLGLGINEIRRWYRDPRFMAVVKKEIEKARGKVFIDAESVMVRTLEGDDTLTRDQKWAAKEMLKFSEAVAAREIRLATLVQKFEGDQNIYNINLVEKSDDHLKQISESYGDAAEVTDATFTETDSGNGDGDTSGQE